jgi:formylglycine-generating enzyme required for sulfatase activity
VSVPAGTYVVGAQASDPGAPGFDPLATGGELAVQTVSTPGFWIQKHEVTTASFRLCKDCMAHGVLEDEPGNLGLPDRMNHPVNGVSWHAAQAYCAFLGARLPTEVEWELHARGPDARRWPWGDEPGCGVAFVRGDQVPWTERMARPPCDTHGTTVLSGLRGDTVFGTVGAAANVAEWTASSWTDGSARRVVRGGSFMNRDAGDLRGAARDGLPPGAQLLDVGFRCLWQPTP